MSLNHSYEEGKTRVEPSPKWFIRWGTWIVLNQTTTSASPCLPTTTNLIPLHPEDLPLPPVESSQILTRTRRNPSRRVPHLRHCQGLEPHWVSSGRWQSGRRRIISALRSSRRLCPRRWR